jgi:hypothetical protein
MLTYSVLCLPKLVSLKSVTIFIVIVTVNSSDTLGLISVINANGKHI